MINLSNRSINLLKSENRKWYQGYVLGDWDDIMEFQPYFAVGAAFARCMESRAKNGDYALEVNAERMHEEFITHFQDEEYDKALVQLHDLIENAKTAKLSKPIEVEKQILLPLNDKYQLKIKMDAWYEDIIMDHKSVSSFTKEEEADEKYGQQRDIYQYAVYKTTGEKMPIVFKEILKKKPSLPRKKDDLLDMLTDEQKEKAEKERMKVEEIRNLCFACATPEMVSQDIVFAFDDALIPRVEKLLERAMLKADWLQTLELDQIL